MTPRRSFLRGLAAGLALGFVQALPGIGGDPVKPERPATKVSHGGVCPWCGFNAKSIGCLPHGQSDRERRAARLASLVLQDRASELIDMGRCPYCLDVGAFEDMAQRSLYEFAYLRPYAVRA